MRDPHAEQGLHDRRPRVLVLTEFYRPAHRAGGPVRTLADLVDRLEDDVAFAVVTGDRDLGDREPLPGVGRGAWRPAGRHRVLRLRPGPRGLVALARVLRSEPHDLVYVNSLFSRRFGIAPLVLRRLRLVPRRPLVLAPRGELNPGALGLRPRRKAAFLRAARALRLYAGVRWQASSPYEAEAIRAGAGRDAEIAIAPNLVVAPPAPAPRPAKRPGRLRGAFLGRIAPMKNLLGALEALDGLEGEMALDVHGPVEDRAYWARCEARIARLPANVAVRACGPVAFGEAS